MSDSNQPQGFPLAAITALLEYVETDLQSGVQMNPEWNATTQTVRAWLESLPTDSELERRIEGYRRVAEAITYTFMARYAFDKAWPALVDQNIKEQSDLVMGIGDDLFELTSLAIGKLRQKAATLSMLTNPQK